MATQDNPYTAQASPNGYSAVKQDYQGYQGAQATSTGYDASNVNPYGKASVTDNLTTLLDQNSPLMQRASQKGLEVANQRGLLNSSIAAGAAQASLYDVAVPLATSDAQLFSQNQQFNAGAINRAREFGAAAQNTASLANQASQNRANEFSAAAANTAFGNTAAFANQAAQFNAGAANQAAQFNAEQANLQQRLSMDNQNKINLANIEANYKNVIQTSDSAQEVVKSYQAGIAQIQQNKDLDAAAKLRATQNLYESTKAALSVLGGVANLNLVGSFPELITNQG